MTPRILSLTALAGALVGAGGAWSAPHAAAAEVDARCHRAESFVSCRYVVPDALGRERVQLGFHRPTTRFAGAIPLGADALAGPERAAYARIEALLPEGRPPEGSLAWLLADLDAPRAKPRGSRFGWVSRVAPRWIPGPAEAPGTYRTFVAPEAWPTVRARYTDPAVLSAADRTRLLASEAGWLVYFGEDHGPLEAVAERGGARLAISRHGVVLERGGAHAWLYVHGAERGGGRSLSKPSIRTAYLRDGLVLALVEHDGAPRRLIAIDPDSGAFGEIELHRLPFAPLDERRAGVADRWLIGDEELELVRVQSAVALDFEALRAELRAAVSDGAPMAQSVP